MAALESQQGHYWAGKQGAAAERLRVALRRCTEQAHTLQVQILDGLANPGEAAQVQCLLLWSYQA